MCTCQELQEGQAALDAAVQALRRGQPHQAQEVGECLSTVEPYFDKKRQNFTRNQHEI